MMVELFGTGHLYLAAVMVGMWIPIVLVCCAISLWTRTKSRKK